MTPSKIRCLRSLLPLTAKAGVRSLCNKIICSKATNADVQKLALSDYVWKDLDKWSDKTALECAETGRNYSYEDVYKKSNKVANFLANLKGLNKEDVIATILPNVPEYAIIVLGAAQAGLKITPLNPEYTKEEINHCLAISKPRIIFTLTDLWPNVSSAVSAFPKVPIVVMNHRNEVMDIPSGAIKLSEVLQNTYPAKRQTHGWNDVIYLPYSSGTTGLFKCIELTNENMVSSIHHHTVPEFKMQTPTNATNQDVFPAILPMYHIYGIHTILLNMSLGCKAITVPKFTTKTFIGILENTRPTHCYLVPPLVQLLVKEPRIKPEYLTRMRSIQVGAAPLGINDVRSLNEKTKGKVHILQGYGLTETTGATHWQTPHIAGGVKMGGCGLSYPTMECKIKNEQGEMLGSNEKGTVFLRGSQVFKGYLNNPEATQSALSSAGWLNTGDIGYHDEDGHLFITDRSKEMIKVKGLQVAPAEIEDILRSHPDVDEAAVVGLPHDRFGEVPIAFIVTRSTKRIDLKSIDEFVASKVAKHKRLLGGIVVTDYIPKTASGKILRRYLKRLPSERKYETI